MRPQPLSKRLDRDRCTGHHRDIDLVEGKLTINRSLGVDRSGVGFNNRPKTDAGRRSIDLDPKTVAALKSPPCAPAPGATPPRPWLPRRSRSRLHHRQRRPSTPGLDQQEVRPTREGVEAAPHPTARPAAHLGIDGPERRDLAEDRAGAVGTRQRHDHVVDLQPHLARHGPEAGDIVAAMVDEAGS